MYEEEDDICSSFTLLLKGIQTETNILKCVSQLRSLPADDKLTNRIFQIEAAVQNIEKNLEDFNDFLTSEIKTCDLMGAEIVTIAEIQTKKITDLENSLPQSLIDAIITYKTSITGSKENVSFQEVKNVRFRRRNRFKQSLLYQLIVTIAIFEISMKGNGEDVSFQEINCIALELGRDRDKYRVRV